MQAEGRGSKNNYLKNENHECLVEVKAVLVNEGILTVKADKKEVGER